MHSPALRIGFSLYLMLLNCTQIKCAPTDYYEEHVSTSQEIALGLIKCEYLHIHNTIEISLYKRHYKGL